jgi:hypothetical protein
VCDDCCLIVTDILHALERPCRKGVGATLDGRHQYHVCPLRHLDVTPVEGAADVGIAFSDHIVAVWNLAHIDWLTPAYPFGHELCAPSLTIIERVLRVVPKLEETDVRMELFVAALHVRCPAEPTRLLFVEPASDSIGAAETEAAAICRLFHTDYSLLPQRDVVLFDGLVDERDHVVHVEVPRQRVVSRGVRHGAEHDADT